MGNKSYQLTRAGWSAQVWYWLVGKSYFPCRRIFIFCFSEHLGINIESLNSFLLRIQFLIQIYFDGLFTKFEGWLRILNTKERTETLKMFQNSNFVWENSKVTKLEISPLEWMKQYSFYFRLKALPDQEFQRFGIKY